MKKGCWSIFSLITLVIILRVLPARCLAETIDSGTCGASAIWELSEEGTLTISGTGAMEDYSVSSPSPWHQYADSQINKIVIKDGITIIGDYSFFECSSSNVFFEASVVRIGDSAFRDCKGITAISTSYVTKFGDCAFYGCEDLKKVSLYSHVEQIGEKTFAQCKKLEEVHMPSTIKTIGENAFRGDDAITQFYIVEMGGSQTYRSYYSDGSSVYTTGGLYSPAPCTLIQYPAGKVDEVCVLPNYLIAIGKESFSNSRFLTTIILKEKVETIEDRAFQNCTHLENVQLSDSVKSMGADVFSGCSKIKELVIPCNVDSMGSAALGGCSALKKVYFRGDAPNAAADVFPDHEFTVYYPSGNDTWTNEYRGSFGDHIIWAEYDAPLPASDIRNYDITVAEGAVFNGEEQCPSVSVTGGDQTFVAHTDYEVEYSDNVNAGLATVVVSGKGDYTGATTLHFEIARAEASLSFDVAGIEKTMGDGSFTNHLNAVTDGKITFASGNASVATVNASNGEVTIRGAGSTVIRASAAEGTNYLAGESSYTLTVQEASKQLTISNLSFSFANKGSAFGYSKQFVIPLESYQIIFGNTTKASYWYSWFSQTAWRGSCAGFSSVSSLLTDPSSGVSVTEFDSEATAIRDLKVTSTSSKQSNLDIKTFIEAMQTAQSTQLFSTAMRNHRVSTKDQLETKKGNLNGLLRFIQTETEAGRPVVLALQQGDLGHAVLAYGTKTISEKESRILLYDNNFPLQERALTIKKDLTGNYMEWSYEIGGAYGTWGTARTNSSISYVPYSVIKEIWRTRGHLEENENVVAINSLSVAIYDSADKLVATVTEGDLSTKSDDIRIIEELSLEKEGRDKVLLSLPVNVYTFENLDKSAEGFEVAMACTNLGATVSTSAKSITLAVDDSCNLNAAYIDAEETDTYSVTLNSTFSYDEDNVVVTGKGRGERLEISQMKGKFSISNCQITSISVDGVEVKKYRIRASAGQGGSITPAGETVLVEGESKEYKIEAQDGYVISKVLVDGKSIGAVRTYTFDKVTKDHEIKAEFVKKISEQPTSPATTKNVPEITKEPETTKVLESTKVYSESRQNSETSDSGVETKETTKAAEISTSEKSGRTTESGEGKNGTRTPNRKNEITAEDIVLTASKKVQTAKIKAKVQEAAKLSYRSNNPAVKVSAKGKVTIPKNFVGSAEITVTAAPTENYSEVSTTISVAVNPTGTTLKKVKNTGAKQITVTWKRNKKVTGYQISYSTSSKFKKAKTVTIKKNKTLKKVIKKLKKKKYYIRIRTYKTVAGKKYYSKWSKKKTIRVR